MISVTVGVIRLSDLTVLTSLIDSAGLNDQRVELDEFIHVIGINTPIESFAFAVIRRLLNITIHSVSVFHSEYCRERTKKRLVICSVISPNTNMENITNARVRETSIVGILWALKRGRVQCGVDWFSRDLL